MKKKTIWQKVYKFCAHKNKNHVCYCGCSQPGLWAAGCCPGLRCSGCKGCSELKKAWGWWTQISCWQKQKNKINLSIYFNLLVHRVCKTVIFYPTWLSLFHPRSSQPQSKQAGTRWWGISAGWFSQGRSPEVWVCLWGSTKKEQKNLWFYMDCRFRFSQWVSLPVSRKCFWFVWGNILCDVTCDLDSELLILLLPPLTHWTTSPAPCWARQPDSPSDTLNLSGPLTHSPLWCCCCATGRRWYNACKTWLLHTFSSPNDDSRPAP